MGKNENEGEEEEGEQNNEGAPSLHFFDCTVQGEPKGDANIHVVLSCSFMLWNRSSPMSPSCSFLISALLLG